LERGTEPLGFGLSLGKPTAEVFDLVPLLGDGGVLGGKLGPVGALSRAAVLGELHFVSNAGGPLDERADPEPLVPRRNR